MRSDSRYLMIKKRFRNVLGLIVCICFISLDSVFSQVIKVIDNETKIPIPNVRLSAKEGGSFLHTSPQGTIPFNQLHIFDSSDTLFFHHVLYHSFSIVLSGIERKKEITIILKKKSVFFSPIIISANRYAQVSDEVAQKVLSLYPKSIVGTKPQTTADLLNHTRAVFIQKSQQGGGSPMLRGFAANSVLITLDGVRINNAIFRSGNVHNIIAIDPFTIEKAEVVLGPGSILYGSDALGGVMNFITSHIRSHPTQLKINSNLHFQYNSSNQERTFHGDFKVLGPILSSYTSITTFNFRDLRSGTRRNSENEDWGKRFFYVKPNQNGQDILQQNDNISIQRSSGYRQLNIFQKFSIKPSQVHHIGIQVGYSATSDVPRYDRLIVTDLKNNTPAFAEWFYHPQQWFISTINWNYSKPNPVFHSSNMILNYQSIQEGRNYRGFGMPVGISQLERVNVINFNLNFLKYFGISSEFSYGVEMNYNDVQSSVSLYDLDNQRFSGGPTRYPGGGSDYITLASYVQHKWRIKKNIIYTLGLRYSHVWLSSLFLKNDENNFPFNQINLNTGSLSWSSGIVFDIFTHNQLNIKVSSGFRAPNIDDISKVFESTPDYLVIPNPDLQPEYTYNIDVGMIHRWGSWRIEYTGYLTWLRNVFVRRALEDTTSSIYTDNIKDYTGIETIQNAGSGIIRGFGITLNGTFMNNFLLKVGLVYTYGRDNENKEPLRHIPPFYGGIDLTYKHSFLSVTNTFSFNEKKTFEQMPLSERGKTHIFDSNGTPDWWTWGIHMDINPTSMIKIGVKLDNILDIHYRPYSSGISGAGRHIATSLSISF